MHSIIIDHETAGAWATSRNYVLSLYCIYSIYKPLILILILTFSLNLNLTILTPARQQLLLATYRYDPITRATS